MSPRVHDRWVLVLLLSVLALSAAGLVMVYSASSVVDYVQRKNSAYHLLRQLQWLIIGWAALWVASRVELRFDPRRRVGWRDAALYAWGLWALSVAGLALVLVAGRAIQGSQRWIELGSVSVQPSEFAKLACIMLTALFLARWKRGRITGLQVAWRIVLTTGTVLLLVLEQPDMGTAMAIAAPVYVLLILGDVPKRYWAGAVAIAAPAVYLLATKVQYRAERVTAFIDPWKDPHGAGYQIIQSLYAFGSGGLTGVGLGLSRQKFNYLPAAHTDFIFAIIGEELGLVGALAVVATFATFTYAGMQIAKRAANPFDRLLAGGITAMVAVQAIINMGAVTRMMPITGIPLPFVSYGGSSLMFTLACVGLVVGVARRTRVREMRPVRFGSDAVRTAGVAVRATDPRYDARKGTVREIPSQRRRDSGTHTPRASRRGAAGGWGA